MAPTASVNKPTDVKQKEADVNRKLQLYGIFNAVKLGKVPSVRLICPALNFPCSHVLTGGRRMTKLMLP